MNLILVELVKTLNKLVKEYNAGKHVGTITDIQKFEFYVRTSLSEAGMTIQEVNRYINNQ